MKTGFVAEFGPDDGKKKTAIDRYTVMEAARVRHLIEIWNKLRTNPFYSAGDFSKSQSNLKFPSPLQVSMINCYFVCFPPGGKWDKVAHGFVGSSSVIPVDYTPCAKADYVTWTKMSADNLGNLKNICRPVYLASPSVFFICKEILEFLLVKSDI